MVRTLIGDPYLVALVEEDKANPSSSRCPRPK